MAEREEDTTRRVSVIRDRLRRAVARVLRNPATSKRAKVASGRGLTRASRSVPPAARPAPRPRPKSDVESEVLPAILAGAVLRNPATSKRAKLPRIDFSVPMPAVKVPRS